MKPQPGSDPSNQQFDRLAVSELFCSRCQRSQPVRRHLLLVLPSGNKYDYRCAACGHSVGSEDESSDDFELLRP